jgi:hypothetical protein
MQVTAQEMWFTEDPCLHEGKKVGYLDPFRVSEDAHTVVMGGDNDLFVCKTEAEITKIRVEEQVQKELAVATYIGDTFLEFQDGRVVCAPYMFQYVGPNSLNNFYSQSYYCLNT